MYPWSESLNAWGRGTGLKIDALGLVTLLALTALAADWWGFTNVISMIISVAVRCIMVAQNQAGIDANIQKAQKALEGYPAKRAKYNESMERLVSRRQNSQAMEGVKIPIEPQDLNKIAKVIVLTEDSKVVTLAVPAYLPKLVFATNPQPPNRYIYQACQWIGWAAFAVHVISIGMAALYTQIVSVVLILVSTILTAHRVGCEDSRIWETIRSHWGYKVHENSCWVSSNLKATVSIYPEQYMDWPELEENKPLTVHVGNEEKIGQQWTRPIGPPDLESTPISTKKKDETRQDLFAWLDLTTEEDKVLTAWGLIPHSLEWQNVYREKKDIHRRRLGMIGLEPTN